MLDGALSTIVLCKMDKYYNQLKFTDGIKKTKNMPKSNPSKKFTSGGGGGGLKKLLLSVVHDWY